METLEQIKRPTKAEQKIAIDSYSALSSALKNLDKDNTEIEIEETKERIKIPLKALRLLGDILSALSVDKLIYAKGRIWFLKE